MTSTLHPLKRFVGRALPVALLLSMAAGAGALAAEKPAQDPELTELLKKLAAHDDRVENAFHDGAMTVTSHTEELDKNGKVETSTDVKTRITHDANGNRTAKVLTATKDGKDAVAEEQRKADRQEMQGAGRGAGKNFGLAASPFASVSQPKYTFESFGKDLKDPSLLRIKFRPVEPNSEVSAGEALVDPVAGELVHVTAHPAENPHFVDQANFELDYGAKTPGVGRTLSRMNLEAEGSFLFLYKHVRAQVTFSEFDFKAPAAK